MSKAKATQMSTSKETESNFKKRLRKFVDPKLWKKYELDDDTPKYLSGKEKD